MAPLLAPLLTTLASQGLTLLSSAVMAKGQQVVEQQLGVKLDTASSVELRKLELEHEEWLMDNVLKNKQLELEETRTYMADVQGARGLGVELSKATGWLNQNIMPVLALLTVFSSSMMLWYSPNADVKMAATSFITMVLGYFFGSSKGSKDKQEQLMKGVNNE